MCDPHHYVELILWHDQLHVWLVLPRHTPSAPGTLPKPELAAVRLGEPFPDCVACVFIGEPARLTRSAGAERTDLGRDAGGQASPLPETPTRSTSPGA